MIKINNSVPKGKLRITSQKDGTFVLEGSIDDLNNISTDLLRKAGRVNDVIEVESGNYIKPIRNRSEVIKVANKTERGFAKEHLSMEQLAEKYTFGNKEIDNLKGLIDEFDAVDEDVRLIFKEPQGDKVQVQVKPSNTQLNKEILLKKGDLSEFPTSRIKYENVEIRIIENEPSIAIPLKEGGKFRYYTIRISGVAQEFLDEVIKIIREVIEYAKHTKFEMFDFQREIGTRLKQRNIHYQSFQSELHKMKSGFSWLKYFLTGKYA